jgi:Mg2+ and Co2+ transporter CorA
MTNAFTQPHRSATPTAPQKSELFNLDIETVFSQASVLLENPATSNFAVRFDAAHALCAVDLCEDRTKQWLDDHGSASSETLWFNFWANEVQKPIVNVIAAKYGLPPRLSSLLSPQKSRLSAQSRVATKGSKSSTEKPRPLCNPHTKDVEKNASSVVPAVKLNSSAALSQMSFGDVVANLWHFESVDWGQHYLYVGFNALISVPGIGFDTTSDKPSGQRIWTSLLLCDDGTVFSFFERPTPGPDYDRAVQSLRRNVFNVFRHISLLHLHDNTADALMKVRIRPEPATAIPTAASAREAASLLFYYLFDDWMTTYAFIARIEHPYRDELEKLRGEMSQVADVASIKSLHAIGRQLTVLKLMYKSYEQIVRRILYRQRTIRGMQGQLPDNDLDQDEQSPPDPSNFSAPRYNIPRSYSTNHYYQFDEDTKCVNIHPSATMRLERLLDRIRLYALSEIEECLHEKESLVFMTFNLVTLKESHAIERLTRTTIVLAKATILFLPVSLMTSYFSIQIGDIQAIYSLKTYWVCFAVVTVLSFLFLLAFGVTASRVQGRTVYKSLLGILWDKSKAKKN